MVLGVHGAKVTRRSVLCGVVAAPFVARARAAELKPKGGDQTAELQAAIRNAISTTRVLQLGAGTFETGFLVVEQNLTIVGVPGATKLVSRGDGRILSVLPSQNVQIQGVAFSSEATAGNLLTAEGVEQIVVEDCAFTGGEAGLRFATCGGSVRNNRFQRQEDVGCFVIDSKYMSITGNSVSDISNNGIQVYRSEIGEDGTIVSGNMINKIAAKAGGDGQNGNGINVFRAGNVVVSNNRLSDCAFSGIRNNSGSHSVITGNSISRCNEVALFVEFEFQGAIVADNMIDTVAHGISVTNFDVGGRFAQITGNVLRNLKGFDAHGGALGGGILAEADTVVAQNLVEAADIYGFRLGWGPQSRNITAVNNILRDCRHGIEFSAIAPGPFIISDNQILGKHDMAIVGMDHDRAVTGDLALRGSAPPDNAIVEGNIVRS